MCWTILWPAAVTWLMCTSTKCNSAFVWCWNNLKNEFSTEKVHVNAPSSWNNNSDTCSLSQSTLVFLPTYFLSLSTFYLTNSPPVSRSWPRERGRPSTTIRSWRRSTSTTRRSDVSLTTDIYPRTSTTRDMSWGSWKRLAVGSMCSLFFLFLGGGIGIELFYL